MKHKIAGLSWGVKNHKSGQLSKVWSNTRFSNWSFSSSSNKSRSAGWSGAQFLNGCLSWSKMGMDRRSRSG